MKKLSVTKTRELGLCLSCEICSAACPEGAITMESRFGQFLPRVDDGKCADCGLCLEICPGIDVDPFELRYEKISDSKLDGPCLESYTAYSNNPDIRENTTSGGSITTLIIELIKNKEFDAAFVLPFDTFAGKPARLKATKEISEILSACKSKYVPASVHDVIVALTKRPDLRYIIVGTPCQIHGITKFLKKSKISEENVLFLGLFCDRTLNFNIIRYFEDTYGKSREKLTKFEFRTKEKYGWPGNSKVYFDSGRQFIIDKAVRQQLKPFFQLKRCLFCTDKLNRLADISFGDCYIAGKEDFQGKSSVIVRTQNGKEIFDKYSYLFALEKENVEEIRKSQYLIGRKDNLEYAKIFIKEHNLYPDTTSDYESNKQVARRLAKLYRHIQWGRDYSINKVRFSLFLSRAVRKVRAIRNLTTTVALLGITILEGLFIRRRSRKRHISKRSTPGNVIIVGAGLSNKGAQAMLFTTVDEIRRRLPDKNIYLLSTSDFEREEKEKSIYKFKILPWYFGIKIGLLSFLGNLFRKSDNSKHIENQIREVIKNADFFVDISGYALASSAGCYYSFDYLLNIVIARKFSVPYYILPQSIGPFDYRMWCKILLYPLMRLCLRYPERIFAREDEGVKCVRRFTQNVEKSYDIVLQSKEHNLANIYNKEVRFNDIKIEPKSVGIIPNYHLIERANPDDVYSVYCSLMSRLIDNKKIVYLLRHADKDLQMFEAIKGFFPDNTSVRVISDDLNCIELENIIKQFDFVIASRYHSIIHSYKNGVPALVIGWTTKYHELLKDFNQLDYFFDVRNKIDRDEINSKLNKLIKNWIYEKEKITDKMNSLSRENIFDIFD